MAKLFSSLLVLIPSLFKHMELFTWWKSLWIYNFFGFTLFCKCSFLLLRGCHDPVIVHGLIYLYCFSIFYCWILGHFYLLKITKCWGFPGGAVVKNPPANARRHGFEPWSGKIPHAAEQLSPCDATTEPAL